MAPPKPYHIARQWHLGDFLDRLQADGHLEWKWDYRFPPGKNSGLAVWRISCPVGVPWVAMDTRPAEELAARLAAEHGYIWVPVKRPFGEPQRLEAVAEMERIADERRPHR